MHESTIMFDPSYELNAGYWLSGSDQHGPVQVRSYLAPKLNRTSSIAF